MTGTKPYFGQHYPALWLNLITFWHGLVSLASFYNALKPSPSFFSPLFFITLTLAHSITVLFIIRRQHVGRVLSLSLNYLGMVSCLLGAAHRLGLFEGIDDLAHTFGKGIPFLFIFVMGYGLSQWGQRYEDCHTQYTRVQTVSYYVKWVSIIGFFIAIGIFRGLTTLIQHINTGFEIGLILGALGSGSMFWLMWQYPLAAAMGTKLKSYDHLNGYLLLSPNLLGFLLFFASPLLFSFYLSFTNADIFGARTWIGLENYHHMMSLTLVTVETPTQRAAEVLDIKQYDEFTRFSFWGQVYLIGAQDKLFWLALRNTLLFVIIALPLTVIPAFILANILNSKLRGMAIYRTLFFLPSIAATVGIALIWQQLYNAATGYINYIILLAVILFNIVFRENQPDPDIHWLTDSRTTLLSLVLIFVWQTIGFNTILFLNGLQNIPKTIYEAAMIDGANSEQQFRFITIPLLIPTLILVLITTIFQAMQLFEQGFILMNNNPAGPNYSTLTMTLYLYQIGFQRFNLGYASALAWVVFALILGSTLLLMVSFYGLDGKPSWGEE